MASKEEVVSCESCGEVEGYILDPKCLLCQHVICMTCLNDQRQRNLVLSVSYAGMLRLGL